MGEFNKDANQGGTGKEQQDEKSAFGQFEKGQQKETGQEKGGELRQEKGQEFGQGKDQLAEGTGQQYAQQKEQLGEKAAGAEVGQQQFEKKGERQQGDEDLGEDSKSNIDNQGME